MVDIRRDLRAAAPISQGVSGFDEPIMGPSAPFDRMPRKPVLSAYGERDPYTHGHNYPTNVLPVYKVGRYSKGSAC